MSALPQQPGVSFSALPLSEYSAMVEIGSIAARISHIDPVLEAIGAIVLRVPSVRGLEFNWENRWRDAGLRSRQWRLPGKSGFEGIGVAEVVRERVRLGTIRVAFALRGAPSESGLQSPVRFARFLAEQIGGAVVRAELRRAQAALRSEIRQLRDELATSKLVARASGLLSASLGLPIDRSAVLLEEYSRRQGLSLSDAASLVIAGRDCGGHTGAAYRSADAALDA